MDETCQFMCDGVADFSYQNAIGQVNFTFSPVATPTQFNSTFTGFCPGTYVVTATDAVGCSATTMININPASPLFVSLNPNDATCGQCNGSIAVNVIGQNFPYTYMISPGGSIPPTSPITNLCPGTYNVTVMDALGCMTFAGATVGNGPSLSGVTVSDVIYHESCYMAGDGGVDISVSPAGTYSYLWSNGDTTEDLSNAISGSYWVIVSSAGACNQYNYNVGVTGTNCGSISGKAWVDSNNLCINNPGDWPNYNAKITLNNGAIAFTNSQGDYLFSQVPLGTHTLSKVNAWWMTGVQPSASCAQGNAVTLTSTSNNVGNNQFIDSSYQIADYQIWAFSQNYVPGDTSRIKIYPERSFVTGTALGIVSLVINDSLNYLYANPAPSSVNSTPNGDSLSWTLPIPLYTTYSWSNPPIEVFVSTPTTYTLGPVLSSPLSITSIGWTDPNLNNNVYTVSSAIASSFDPNEKYVQPLGEGPQGKILKKDSLMEYTVVFQNTGTAPARNIRILDTLSDKLDINTLWIRGGSHTYTAQVRNGNILDIYFKDIYLPDSNQNEPMSHGFVTYRIHQKQSNVIGDVIKNTASIYFDYNAPIRTQTTINTLILPTGVSDLKKSNDLRVYPQPTTSKLYVECTADEILECRVMDLQGRMVLNQSNTNKGFQIQLDVDALPSGMYLLEVETNNGNQHQIVMVE